MPTIEIPNKLRFFLYLLGSVGSIAVIYAMDVGFAGEAEYKAWTGLAGLLTLLAAAKTTKSDSSQVLTGTLEQVDGGNAEAAVVVDDERGQVSIEWVVVVVLLGLIWLTQLGAFGHPLR